MFFIRFDQKIAIMVSNSYKLTKLRRWELGTINVCYVIKTYSTIKHTFYNKNKGTAGDPY